MAIDSTIFDLTNEHKIAMLVRGVMISIDDLVQIDLSDLTPKDIDDLALSHTVLGNFLLDLQKKVAA